MFEKFNSWFNEAMILIFLGGMGGAVSAINEEDFSVRVLMVKIVTGIFLAVLFKEVGAYMGLNQNVIYIGGCLCGLASSEILNAIKKRCYLIVLGQDKPGSSDVSTDGEDE